MACFKARRKFDNEANRDKNAIITARTSLLNTSAYLDFL